MHLLTSPGTTSVAWLTLALLTAAQFAGVPVPLAAALLVAGASLASHDLHLSPLMALLPVAGVAGAWLGHVLGVRHGRAAAARIGRRTRLSGTRIAGIEASLRRNVFLVAFLGRWVAPTRVVGSVLAGTTGQPRTAFLAWTALGATGWIATVLAAGYTGARAGLSWTQAVPLLVALALAIGLGRRLFGTPAGELRTWLQEVALPSERHRMLAFFAACAVLCVALRLPYLTAPLGVDEGGNAFIADAWSSTHGSIYGGSWLDRSPLLLLIYRGALLGGPIGVRLLGMVAAIACVAIVMSLASRISSAQGARVAGMLTVLLTSSVLLGAVFTDAELLAAVPSALSLLALVRAVDARRPVPWIALAGLSAACALLVKQSFGDAFVAGAVFLAASFALRASSRFRWSWVVVYGAAFAAPLLAVLAWVHVYSVTIGQFVYALVGFRIASITAIDRVGGSSGRAFLHVGVPTAIASGALLLLPWAVRQLWMDRRRSVVALTLGAWLVAGMVGVMGGGSYFPHYFIELIPALAVLGGCGLAGAWRRPLSITTMSLLGMLTVANFAAGAALQRAAPPQERTLAVARYLQENDRPGDSLYVMYARANLLYYSGLRAAFPYNWSLMIQTIPGAEDRLRATLDSPRRRPTWIVEWQRPSDFSLDRSGATQRLLDADYRRVAVVCGKDVLLRRDAVGDRHLGNVDETCHAPMIPSDIARFVSHPADRSDGVDYLWQG